MSGIRYQEKECFHSKWQHFPYMEVFSREGLHKVCCLFICLHNNNNNNICLQIGIPSTRGHTRGTINLKPYLPPILLSSPLQRPSWLRDKPPRAKRVPEIPQKLPKQNRTVISQSIFRLSLSHRSPTEIACLVETVTSYRQHSQFVSHEGTTTESGAKWHLCRPRA